MKKNKTGVIIAGVLFTLAYIVFIVTYWIKATFGIGLEELVFTITSPLDGTDMGVFFTALKFCLPRIIIMVMAYAACVYLISKINRGTVAELKLYKKVLKFNVVKTCKSALAILSVICLLLSVVYVDKRFEVVDYFKNQTSYTKLYDEYYIDPQNADISLKNRSGGYKNLLYIYLESMENTYSSVENGGAQDIDYIPNLSRLAAENVSFSDTEKLGGFYNVSNTNYTMGALLGTTAGIPFCFPIGENDMNKHKKFAPGLTTLGDILDGFGYNQEFLCGSDADFAGRRNYFEQHGYKIFDYNTAIKKGYIDEDYFVFWGLEDKRLYEIAKDELLRLSKKDEPFNLTMLTVDTHHVEGYRCSICGNEYDTRTKNVVSCADRQVAEFIEWCKEQEFYKDTVIVITGDHPRMDTEMVDGVDQSERKTYNCFINCKTDKDVKTTDRTFTALDIFPTTLHALGFEWDSSRLGLGTNMFSGDETLAEELGLEYFDSELSKKTKYVVKFY